MFKFAIRIKVVLAAVVMVTSPIVSDSQRARAQELVLSRSPQDGSILTRRGTIVEWRGGELVIDSAGGPKRIANQDLIRVEIAWRASYQTARSLVEKRQFLEAIPELEKAIADEPRSWAQQIIRGELIRCLTLAGQHQAAGQYFIQLIADDPNTRLMGVIPLAWGSAAHDLNLQAEAQRWMASNQPAVSLLGASWLLGTPLRSQAIEVLEGLARDIDPRVAHLASAQLWRIQVVSADARAIERWSAQIERMPIDLRAGPRKVLAEGYERNGRPDESVLELMKIALLQSDQFALSLAALQQASAMLDRQGQSAAAQRLLREIVRDFPGTAQAEAARLKLQANN